MSWLMEVLTGYLRRREKGISLLWSSAEMVEFFLAVRLLLCFSRPFSLQTAIVIFRHGQRNWAHSVPWTDFKPVQQIQTGFFGSTIMRRPRLDQRFAPVGDSFRRRSRQTSMRTVLSSKYCFSSVSLIFSDQPRNHSRLRSSSVFEFPVKDRDFWIWRKKAGLTLKYALDWATIDQLGLSESEIQNPALSSSYRSSKFPKPNQTVLEAQTKVCTGPTQTKPLSEEQAVKVLETILKSAKGELKDEDEVSKAQLGAFFSAMTIRANAFPEATQWSEGERRALESFWPLLSRVLPPDVVFIADPEGSIMGTVGHRFVGNGTGEMRLVGALREVLAGGHLGFDEVQGVLKDVLPLNFENGKSADVRESLLSAFLIGQRMNRETDRELKAYCLAFDNEIGQPPAADVRSLTHYGEPYDGNTRFFRSTLFVAAVRSCYDESCLLHGVDWMSPKLPRKTPFKMTNTGKGIGGVTEEQMLKFMGANTFLSPLQAKELLEDDKVGFAYVSQREACPSWYSLVGLREHIKKRPPLATTEKVQQFVKARGKEAIVAGFYHEGYEEPLLMLMKRRGVHSGLVVKGEEGALSMTTKLRSASARKGLPVNYCSGFRSMSIPTDSGIEEGVSRQSFNVEINAMDYGFEPTDTPRTDRSVSKNIELGLAALGGEKGPAYDRIILNAGMVDHLLGCDGAEDVSVALDRAREAIDSGQALKRLLSYIKYSNRLK